MCRMLSGEFIDSILDPHTTHHAAERRGSPVYSSATADTNILIASEYAQENYMLI